MRDTTRLLTLLFALSLPVALPALGQQRYELEDDGWAAVDAPDPASPEGQLQAIRKLLAEGKSGRAYKQIRKWISRNPDHPATVEAYLIQGDSLVASGDLYKALHSYEYLIRRYPASEQFHVALEREYEISRLFVGGKKRTFLGLPIFPASEDAAEILIRIQERAPGSDVGERAHLLLGDYYFNSGQMINAAEVYDLFIENYPRSEQHEFAMLRVVQANLARYSGPAYDQRGLIEAQQRLKLYKEAYPASADQIGANALIVRIRESLAKRDLISADWYTQRGRNFSAATMYRMVIEEYPDTAAAAAAVERLADIGYPVVLADPVEAPAAPASPEAAEPEGPQDGE